MSQKPEFYPNIDDYNDENYDGQPITLENLDYFVYKIVAKTGLTYDQVSIIVKLYFNEVRTQVLKGSIINIGDLGKLFIEIKPSKNSKDKFRLKIKFKATKRLIKKVRFNAIR